MSIYLFLFFLSMIMTFQSKINLIPPQLPICCSGQLYQIQLKVQNLTQTKFQFQGLPNGLNGQPNGLIIGNTTKIGFHHIFIILKSGNIQETKSLILNVRQQYSQQNYQSQQFNQLTLQHPQKYIYSTNTEIKFQIKPFKFNQIQKLTWTSKSLPLGLSISQNGLISGSIRQPGRYLFSVKCCNSFNNKQAELFLIFNIQPKSFISKRILLQVPNKQFLSDKNLQLIYKQQLNATQELFKSLDSVNQKYNIAKNKKTQLFSAASKFTQQQKKFIIFNKQHVNLYQIYQTNLMKYQQKNRQLKLSQFNLHQSTRKSIILNQKPLIQKQQNFNQSLQKYNKTNQNYIQAIINIEQAKRKMNQSEQQLTNLILKKISIQKEYQISLKNLQQRQKQMNKTKQFQKFTQQIVAQAFIKQKQTDKIRQQALKELTSQQDEQKIKDQINSTKIANLKILKNQLSSAQKQFSGLQWQFQFLLNKLYIAQARKQTADRASYIAVAQGIFKYEQYLSMIDYNIKQIQVNCQAYTYPAIQGVGTVVQIKEDYYKVSSGNRIKYGKCTDHEAVKVNQSIYYNGFVVNGCIHASTIQKYRITD